MELDVIKWKIRNLPAYMRSLRVIATAKLAPWCGGLISAHGRLYIRKYDAAQQRWVNYGFASARSITDAGVAFMALDFSGGTKDITNFKYHASGTGVTAEGVTDVALGTEVLDNARTAGTNSNPTAPTYQTVNTISYTGAHAITEHGIFDQITVAGSTLWDRSVFAAINVISGDSIQFTYVLTIISGG